MENWNLQYAEHIKKVEERRAKGVVGDDLDEEESALCRQHQIAI